ncbi:MAG: pyruvate dehydrogenase [Dehalococcoidia bacterium]|jgi:pyruvate dehydrogenase E1 component|nr:pyruvate dehydrogenase [Dehalococcoidia bacterium]
MVSVPTQGIDRVRASVRDRVLWLATAIINHANNVRPDTEGTKVGGHQSSSASSVAILTALFFEVLKREDRIAIKPHASPVFHAIHYLLGDLDESYLEKFRAFGGLQAYPSRTKDPEPVDFSTGSVGLAGPAAAFGALTRDYLDTHGLQPNSGRFYAHLGDAELDEGSMWEAVIEPALAGLDRCTWIVDVNRQSLDRVVPGIRVRQFMDMLSANGWTILMAKYGYRLTELMERPGGEALRTRIDDMSNEEYQGLLVAGRDQVRARLLEGAEQNRADIEKCTADVDDEELYERIMNLGGHDVGYLVRLLNEAVETPGPTAIFAYTVKGWGLQSAADPRNHAAVLTQDEFERFAESTGRDAENPWGRFVEDSEEGGYVGRAVTRLGVRSDDLEPPLRFSETELSIPSVTSTQDAFGRMLVELDRTSPESASRIVTASADVATSTGLASWINRTAVWSKHEELDYLGFGERTLRWLEQPDGRHVELGLSEMNMFLLLAQLGLSERMSGKRLVPIGTVYDPFIARATDALINGLYQESRFILVATPSGISLSTEGGAHQGLTTPSLGINTPGITYFEPAFAQEVEWVLLEAVRSIGSGEGGSYLLRLSTKPIDQKLFPVVSDRLRQGVLSGCYRYLSAPEDSETVMNAFVVGAMVDEAIASVELLEREGIGVSLFIVTSPDLLFRRMNTAQAVEQAGTDVGAWDPLELLEDREIGRPVLCVIDGHPHSMAFLGAALDCPSTVLGVTSYGQSGSRADLYRHFGMDARGIFEAGLGLVDRWRKRVF